MSDRAVQDVGAPGVLLTGATGRTGNAVAHALAGRSDVVLAACISPSVATSPRRSLPQHVPAFANLADALADDPDASVIVDFTHASAAIVHMELALANGRHVVLGATGFESSVLEQFGERFAAAGLGLLHVPNFSLGAVLAMQLAEQVAAHFADVEVVETHHDGKRDAPSGTAIHTARRIAAARSAAGFVPGGPVSDGAGSDAARGETVDGVQVHALRLPGATAHQSVVFGGAGELLTIRHDAIDRSCYATGVALAARRVHEFEGLYTGLEHVL